MKRLTLFLAVALIVFAVGAAQAVNIETVPVGNSGNAGELSGASVPGGYGPDRICGAVNYAYNIGKYEVTAGQYAEFLNAVAKADPYGLYAPNMDALSGGCQITRNGTSGSYTYDFSGRPSGMESDWANRPVNFVSWGDAARFCNWLHNGQPTGPQGLATTEDGAYYLNGATSKIDLLTATRKADAKWWIPSEDEWYKAAYHVKIGGTRPWYYDYPTGTNAVPSNALSSPSADPGNNANFYDTSYTIGSPYYRTPVGAFENSDSLYGTFDQGGNVEEWNDAVIYDFYRVARGGSYGKGQKNGLLASYRNGVNPTFEGSGIGFRVAGVPEPSSIAILLAGVPSLLAYVWRRRWSAADFYCVLLSTGITNRSREPR